MLVLMVPSHVSTIVCLHWWCCLPIVMLLHLSHRYYCPSCVMLLPLSHWSCYSSHVLILFFSHWCWCSFRVGVIALLTLMFNAHVFIGPTLFVVFLTFGLVSLVSFILPPLLPCVSQNLEHQTIDKP